ncbi:MAG TPA: tetratricopeptide repeat protein [Alphaproteobacteria bacterium]|nr:tetratricopeptide repeat protein [Alphaproteobacteria bacterium]
MARQVLKRFRTLAGRAGHRRRFAPPIGARFGAFLAIVGALVSISQPAAAQEPGCDARAQRVELCARLIRSGRFEGAILANLYFFRGIAFSRARRHRSAVADYSSAIELNPLWFAPYHNRGADYRVLGQPRRAIADFTSAIRLAPGSVDAYIARGVVFHLDLKQRRRAIADYNRALKIDPRSGGALINRGRAYQELGMRGLAIRDYRRVLKLFPKAEEARTRLRALGVKP